MKKYAVILLCLAPIILFSTLSCDDNSLPPGLQILYDIVIGEVEYETGGTYSFGSIDAEVGSKSVTLTMTNNGEIALTVTAVSLTASDHFTISHEELPLTVSPGESTDVSVTFNPAATGTLEASLSITLEGITDPFVLNLSGEGNSPPEVSFGIEVSGAGSGVVNGTYERISEDYNYPYYLKTGSTNYYCYADGEVYNWHIGENLGGFSDHYVAFRDFDVPYIVPPADIWTINEGGDGSVPAPSVDRYDITGVYGLFGQPLTANYFYTDADGDSEDTAATSFQWYESGTQDGTFIVIDGETSKTFTPIMGDGPFFKVEITPSALTGISPGAAVMSGPSAGISPPVD